MKESTLKRVFCFVLAAVFAIGVVPVGVLAEPVAANASSAQELESALNAGITDIELTADFEIDRTLYVCASTRITASGARTLTRAADFTGDLFVVGVNAGGEATQTPVAFELGTPGGAAITIDGNKTNLSDEISVNGAAIYVTGGASVTVNDSVTFTNNRKDENARAVADALGSAANVGGSAILVANGSATISGATFTGNEAEGEGAAVYFAAGTAGTITDAIFNANKATGENGSGGALGARSADVTVKGTVFENNEAAKNGGAVFASYTSAAGRGSDVSADGCSFVNNSAVGNGGALYATGSSVRMTDASFTGNTAYSDTYGGGALYSTGSTVDIDGASFTNNTADKNGGAIALYSGSTAKLNSITASGNEATGNGGFVYNSGSELRVYDSTISENTATANGGAAALHSQGVSGFYASTFENNEAGGNGGAIYAYTGDSETIVHSCAFESNTATNYGGALFASNGQTTLNIYNSTASANSAKNGGALYETTTGVSVTLNGFTVSGNAATAGPIVYGNTTKAILYINKTNYVDSDASGDLDAAYWSSAIANKLTVTEITDDVPGYYDYYGQFVGEASDDPAEASPEVDSAAAFESALNAGITDIELTANFEIDRTLYVCASTRITAGEARTLTRAADFTGDLFVVGVNAGGEATQTPVAFELGTPGGAAITIDGNKTNLSDEISVNGAAIYVAGGASVTVNDCVTFTSNRKDENARTIADALGSAANVGGSAILVANGSATISGATFTGNEAEGEGAAVYFAAGTAGTITDAIFAGNKATGENGSGGALGARSADVTVEGTVFENNEAAKNGGAVFFSYTSAAGRGSDVSADGCSFVNNSAAGNGGALYATGSSVRMTDASFTGNTANSDSYGGGALYSTGSTVDVDGASFTGNTAAKNGGAIALYSGSTAKLNAITASGNEASGNGGFVYNSGSELRVYDSTISENTATANGGAAALHSQGTSGFYASSFESNEAGGNGGAIYAYTGDSETIVHSCAFEGNTATNYGGALFASNGQTTLNVYNSTASANSAKNGGALYETTTGVSVTLNGFTVSGNTATAGPIVYGNTTKAILYINKTNYVDSDASGDLDAAYWSAAIANKLTVTEITDAVPGYYDYYGQYHAIETALDGVTDVTSSAELEAAIASGAEMIRVKEDFELDRTFYITSTTRIFSTASHTLTRAADFGGDIFVVGESASGVSSVNRGEKAVLELGDPSSDMPNLLTIDGNKGMMTAEVNGTVIFVCFSAVANVYPNVSIINNNKVSNLRTAYERYSLPYTNRIGGAVAIIANGELNIFGGTFSGNTVNDEDTSENAQESGRDCTLGAVIFNYSNLNIHDGVFAENKAARGGVVYNYRMTRIYGGTFRNNTATRIGGAIYQADSQYGELLIGLNCERTGKTVLFEGNTSTSVGGAIFSQTKNAIVIYGATTFVGNSSTGSNGGAICCYGTLAANDAVFENNFAYQRGGAIYVSNADDTLTTRYANVSGTVFRGNRANRGGAVGIFAAESTFSEGGKAIFTECTFENNAAIDPSSDGSAEDFFGGAIYVSRKGTLSVTDSTLSGNTAAQEGGAIYISGGSSVSVSGSTISGNSASGSGANGGAIAIHSARLSISASELNSNTAVKNGGALYVSYTGSSDLNSEVILENADFAQNEAGNYGGALYATAHEVENDTPVVTATGLTFTGNHSPYNGGAAYITNGAKAYFGGAEFRQNTADGLATSSGSRYGGGALYVSGSEVEINGALFESNQSGYNGGAAALYSEAVLTLNDFTATGNTASNNGGFIYANGALLKAYSGTLSANSAKGGGAINVYTSASAELYGLYFESNAATGNGGALYLYNGGTDVRVQDCSFTSNSAENYGGAVYASSASKAAFYTVSATGNGAAQGGFIYETTSKTELTLNGVTVSANTATDAGPIIYGNSAKAILNINKSNYVDSDVAGALDAAYWSAAIAGSLKVNEISGAVPTYDGYSHESGTTPVANAPVLTPVSTIFDLSVHTFSGTLGNVFDTYPLLDKSSNFMSLNTTTFDNVNGSTVTVDSFVNKPNVPYGNPNFAEGLLIYQAMLYKRAHPAEDVSIDISSFRFSVDAAICINRDSRYFGYMRSLTGTVNHDKYGFVRIAYLLIEAASMGIYVNVIGQMDAYPRTGSYDFEHYFTRFLGSACDSSYAPGRVIGDYLDFNFCYWTSYGDDAATDMMHTKVCAVSNYTDLNGVDHANAVWSSSANLDGVTAEGYNGNNKAQTGSIVSDHEALYRVSRNYLRLMAGYCGQEDVYLFRELVIDRTAEQIALINDGRENEIPADEQIVYLGTQNDSVFELYFTPLGSASGVWDEVANPYCKYIGKLKRSDDYIYFIWNNANFIYFPLSTMLLDKVEQAFHDNKDPENRLFLLLKGSDTAAINSAYSDLAVGRDVGSISLNKAIYSDIHNKDIQLSYSENGVRSYVTLLNSLNIHGGSMFYQSNFVLVVKEKSAAEDSVFFTFGDHTSTGVVGHKYGELMTRDATETEHGMIYRQCSECGRIEVERVIHVPSGDWIVDKEASVSEAGVRHRVCAVCGETVEVAEYFPDDGAASIRPAEIEGAVFTGGEPTVSVGTLERSVHTFEATLRVPKSISYRAGVIIGNYGTSGDLVNVEVYTQGRFRLYTKKNGIAHSYFFNTDVRSDEPIHVALTVEGRIAKLYFDGVLKETVTLAAELPDVTGDYLIGKDHRAAGIPYFNGTIYSVALFADVRTPEEIAVDRYTVTGDAEDLLYHKIFDGETHTPGELIVDQPASDTKRGIGHTECVDCKKVLEVVEIPCLTATATSYDITATDGLNIGKDEIGVKPLGNLTSAPHTFEATIHLPRSYAARGGVIVSNYGENKPDQICIEVYTNGKLRLYYTVNSTIYSYMFKTDVRSDRPVHLALTVGDDTASLYLDGVKKESVSIAAPLPDCRLKFCVAGDLRASNAQYFKGKLYSLALFDDVRSDEEIARDRVLVLPGEDGLICSEYYSDAAPSADAHAHDESETVCVVCPHDALRFVCHTECTSCGAIVRAWEKAPEGEARTVVTDGKNGKSGFDAFNVEKIPALSGVAHTFEATILVPASVSQRGGVIVGNYGGSGDVINFEIHTGGKVRLYARKNGVPYNVYFNTDIRSDEPVHVAVTVEGTEAKLYINGAFRESASLGTELPAATDGFRIGSDNRSFGVPYFAGTIYSVALFDDARTAEEIAVDRLFVPQDADGLLFSEVLEASVPKEECPNKLKIGDLQVTPLTIESTITLSPAVTGRGGVIFGNFSAKANGAGQLSFEIYTNGNPRLYYIAEDGEHNVVFDTDARSDREVSLTLVIDGLSAKLYLNGELVETKTLDAPVPARTTDYRIGGDNRPYNTQNFKGTITNVVLFSDVRTDEEILADTLTSPEGADGVLYDHVSKSHTAGEWIVDQSADALRKGVRHRECTGCGKVLEVAEIPCVHDALFSYDPLSMAGRTFTSATDSLVAIPELASAPHTIEATVSVPTAITQRAGVIVSNYASADDQISLEIYNAGKPRLFIVADGQRYDTLFKTDIRGSDPVHIAVTFGDGYATLYVNGVAKETVALDASPTTALGGYFVGGDSRAANAQYFKGTIYSAALFADVRTADEVASDAILVTGDSPDLMYRVYFTD